MRKLTAYILLGLFVLTFVIPVSAIDLGIFRKLNIRLQQNEVGITVKGVASQSANLIECQDSTGSSVFSVGAGGVEVRSTIGYNIDQYTGVGASVEVTDPITITSGGFQTGYYAINGDSAITQAGPNEPAALIAISNLTAAGVKSAFVAQMNGTGATIDECIKAVATNGTATYGLAIEENGGTITNDIILQNGETIVIGIQTGASTYMWYVGGLNPESVLTPTDGA